MSVIYAFVKIFEEESYAKDFMAGKLCMNTIGSFKEYRDESGELRGDEYEGAVAIHQPEKISGLSVGGVDINPGDLAAPIVVHKNELLNHNVFCIYSLNSRGLDEVSGYTVQDLRKAVELHRACFGLGKYCVVVTSAQEFINRAQSAIRDLNVHANLGLVDYYDEREFHGCLDESKLGFQKRSMFSHQREYRIRINFKEGNGDRFFLDVGDLTDITELTTPEEFNEKLEVKHAEAKA